MVLSLFLWYFLWCFLCSIDHTFEFTTKEAAQKYISENSDVRYIRPQILDMMMGLGGVFNGDAFCLLIGMSLPFKPQR